MMSRLSRLRWLSVVVLSTLLMCPMPASSNQTVPANIVSQVPPRAKKCSFPIGTPPSAACIALGKQIFENETFGGNGRTCATCHPASNNFTIDVPYINKLPNSDPLFVFETNPSLTGLETPLLRSNALICENLDGFSNACVLRGVPHTLGLRVTASPDPGPFDANPGVTPARPAFPLAGALGWSGDGSPGDGSLRNFAVGAVFQHFTKTLKRLAGVDFRLPTADELDALEAFQLSLGRQGELNLNPDPSATNATFNCQPYVAGCPGIGIFAINTNLPNPSPSFTGTLIQFNDGNVTTGQLLFFGGVPSQSGPQGKGPNVRSCSGCHVQAGAGSPFAMNQATPPSGYPLPGNRNRATGAEIETVPLPSFLTQVPACLSNAVNPNSASYFNSDGGFGVGNPSGSPVVSQPDYVVTRTNYNPLIPGNPATLLVDQGSITPVGRGSFCGTNSISTVSFTGTRFFNTPSVIEAASTIPLFHNNIAQTVEESVLFYTTTSFNNSISGAGRALLLSADNLHAGGDSTNCAVAYNTQGGSQDCVFAQQIGAFLRAINALDSEKAAYAYLDAALNSKGPNKVTNIQLAIHKMDDAIGVLSACSSYSSSQTPSRLCGPITLFTTSAGNPVISNFQSAKTALGVQGKSPNALNSLKPGDLTAAQSLLVSACSAMQTGGACTY